MLLFHTKTIMRESLNSPTDERKKKTNFGSLATFWFGAFAMHFVPLIVLYYSVCIGWINQSDCYYTFCWGTTI